MIKYALGFLLRPKLDKVLLIRKCKPAWQAGRLNGIGGHLLENETPLDGMRREFLEETGCALNNWVAFATLERTCQEHSSIEVFYGISPSVRAHSMTEEAVGWYRIANLPHGNSPVVADLPWLLATALYAANNPTPPMHYIIRQDAPICAE